jgi:hypothetical protein
MEQGHWPATDKLPPGTQRIENETGAHIVLSPIPSSDPNQPLVSSAHSRRAASLTMTELANVEKSITYCPSVPLQHPCLCSVSPDPGFQLSETDAHKA